MKRFFLIFIVLTMSHFLQGQGKTLTVNDCIYNNIDLFPDYLYNLQWIPESDYYSYIQNDTLFMQRTAHDRDRLILTCQDLKKSFIKHPEFKVNSLKRFPFSIKWVDKYDFYFSYDFNLYLYNLKNKEIKLLNKVPDYSPENQNADLSNVAYHYAFTQGNDLYIMKNGEEILVARSEGEGIIYGTERAHRNEFGINKGTFWSPQDNYLAFYRMDESMVTNYPMLDISGYTASVKNTRYPMAGMPSHEVTLGIYDITTGNTVYIKTDGPADQYLTAVTWDPSEKYIYIAILNRDQNHLKFNKYDIKTGKLVKTLFEEKDKEYVEPLTNPEFLFSISDRFIWQSRRDGWNHLYLYNTEGQLIKQITEGQWEVTGIIGINKKQDRLFFTATKESPLENHIYSVDIKSGTIKKLSEKHGTHDALLSSDSMYMIDHYTSTDVINRYEIINSSGKNIKTILDSPNPLEDYSLGNVTIGKLKNKNNDDLYYRMITPPDFDPSKKYPVFYYVYGGPHLQMVTDTRYGGSNLWDYRWAQRGYIVFSMDNRGTPNRGADFEQAIHRQLGVLEIEDQMVGINYLKSLPYVDSNRMAVDGWSYGGFMTISLMLKEPDIFKAGCAGGPVIDWKYYEVMYGERYMDTPEQNPQGYKNASLLNFTKNLKGKLLVIHGVTDPVVVMQNSLEFIDKCIKTNVQVDYFVYPGHEHNVMGIDRAHLYRKIEGYIDDVIFK